MASNQSLGQDVHGLLATHKRVVPHSGTRPHANSERVPTRARCCAPPPGRLHLTRTLVARPCSAS
jgi:hypothetical protein